MKIQNKTLVVTGAGSGIGLELVKALIAKGARIAAVDISETNLNTSIGAFSAEQQARISKHVVNIADKAIVDALPQQVLDAHGTVDGIINNAGIIQPFIRINDLNIDTIERVMHVNFYGTLYMVKAFLPLLLERPEAHITNISSMGGFLPVPGQSIYGAAKAAVKLMTEGLNAELMNTNVQVTVVFPGAIGTNIMKNSGLEMPKGAAAAQGESKMKPLAPEKAAEIIVAGIEKNKPRLFVGKDSRMMDLLYRVGPNFATKMIAKKMQMLLK